MTELINNAVIILTLAGLFIGLPLLAFKILLLAITAITAAIMKGIR